jgi:hypothetical protein
MGWTEKMADYLLLHPEAIPELLNLAHEIGPRSRFFSLLPHTTLVKSAQNIPNLASILINIREKETDSELQAYLDRELNRLP